jgi:hypothetical protein
MFFETLTISTNLYASWHPVQEVYVVIENPANGFLITQEQVSFDVESRKIKSGDPLYVYITLGGVTTKITGQPIQEKEDGILKIIINNNEGVIGPRFNITQI